MPEAGDPETSVDEIKEKRAARERTKLRILGLILFALGAASFVLQNIQDSMVSSDANGVDKTTLSDATDNIIDPLNTILTTLLREGLTTFVALYSSAAENSRAECKFDALKVYNAITTVAFVVGLVFTLAAGAILSAAVVALWEPLFRVFGSGDLVNVDGADHYVYYAVAHFFLAIIGQTFFSNFLIGDFKMMTYTVVVVATLGTQVVIMFTFLKNADNKLLASRQMAVICDAVWIIVTIGALIKTGFFKERRFNSWKEVTRSAKRSGGIAAIAHKGLWLFGASLLHQVASSIHGFQRRDISKTQVYAMKIAESSPKIFIKIAQMTATGLLLVLLPRMYSGRLYAPFKKIMKSGMAFSALIVALGYILCLFVPGMKKEHTLKRYMDGESNLALKNEVAHLVDEYYPYVLANMPFEAFAGIIPALLLSMDHFRWYAGIKVVSVLVFGTVQAILLPLKKDLRYGVLCGILGSSFEIILAAMLFFGLLMRKFRIACLQNTTAALVDADLKESFSSALGLDWSADGDDLSSDLASKPNSTDVHDEHARLVNS